MVEVKNHVTERVVRREDREKAIRDLDGNKCSCGVFIAIQAPISSRKSFQIERTPKGKPLIYITINGD